MPDVIERGTIVMTATHGREESFNIAAPVDLHGSVNVVTALVKRDSNRQAFYLHSVMQKEGLLNPRVSRAGTEVPERTGASNSEGLSGSVNPSGAAGKATSDGVASVLRDAISAHRAQRHVL